MRATILHTEARAQLGMLVMSLIALAAAAMLPWKDASGLTLIVSAYGMIFLGAQSVGHEYSHRTLTMALAQPVSRARIYIVKLAVLVVMLVILAGATALALGSELRGRPAELGLTFLGLPVIGAIFVAPLMTMIARGVLGGALMSCFAGGLVWLVLMIEAAWRLGGNIDDAGSNALRNLPFAIIALSAVTGLLGWRRFMRLEALEGDFGAISFPRLLGTSNQRRHSPWRALIVKELHLQQLTLGITLQYLVTWAVLSWVIIAVPAWSSFPLSVVTVVYCMILPVIVGATASAEERHAGTHGWQLLQPVAAWQQWLVKVLVVIVLSGVCGLGLPMLLATLLQDKTAFELGSRLATACLFLTCAALYVSTISTSTVKTMVLALPIGLGLGLLLQTVARTLGPGMFSSASDLLRFGWIAAVMSPAFVAIVTPLLLWFGFVNHSSTEQPVARAIGQGAAIAVVASAALITV